MKLITVEASFAPETVAKAVTRVLDQADQVRAMPGCQHYAVFHDAPAGKVAILQHWDDLERFDAYRTGDVFAALGRDLGPLMSAPPVTIVGEVDTV